MSTDQPFFVANKGEQSTKFALMLSRAKERFVVRMTGGCGHMSREDAYDLYELFVDAFVEAKFGGAILYGGTRMVKRSDPTWVVPGITEIPPRVARRLDVVTLGVVPRTTDLVMNPQFGLVVSEEVGNDFVTIVHPEQTSFLIVQGTVDTPTSWDTEWQECLQITTDMRVYAGWRSLLICYNGGGVTERELLAVAELGWPVMVVAGSGRTSDKYARDFDFLSLHPNVMVVEKSSAAIADALCDLAIEAPKGRR